MFESERPERRPYVQGSVMELYRGEPLLIVYGTQSDEPARRERIRSMAEKLSTFCNPVAQMEFGRVPAKADSAVDPADLETNNLFLLGGPEDNAITARLMGRMPIREADGALQVFDSERIPLEGSGYGFVFPNPEQPARLVFIYSSADERYFAVPEWGQKGGSSVLHETGREPHPADLFVEALNADGSTVARRLMSFTYGWKPACPRREALGRQPASALDFAALEAEALRKAARTPFAAISRGKPGDPCPYDPAHAHWEELALLLPREELVTFEISGADLLDLHAKTAEKEWGFFPEPTPETVEAGATYRAAAFVELAWQLGSLSYTPHDTRVVPDGPAAFRQAAREVWQVDPNP